MNTMSCLAKIARHWRAFGRAEDGNVAIVFGLSLIPLVGLIGGAIDYSRASAVRTALQTAADATALAISKDAPSTSATDLQAAADKYLKSLVDQGSTRNIKVTATYTEEPNSKVVVDASADVDSYFVRVWPFNITEIPVGVSSTTTWGNTRMRVALALDNTGSMASRRKMEKLKEATKDLIDTLTATAGKTGDVLISIVPFSRDVNVGKGKWSANWIDWTDWDEDNGQYERKKVCKTKKNGKIKCKKKDVWVPDPHNTWNGCIADRDQDYDVSNAAPDPKNKSTLFPADQYRDCPSELIALTDVKTQGSVATLKKTVNDMYPDGYTNITIGLAWAWQSLTQTAPLNAPPQDPNYEYQKIIILLTDGQNTWNRFSTRTSAIDKRTEEVCQAIKADGIKVYSILVIEGNASLLEQCASPPDEINETYYYYLRSADEIETTFNEIGAKLSTLRVAQ